MKNEIINYVLKDPLLTMILCGAKVDFNMT